MVTLQIISKILNTQNISIVEDNLLTKDYFVGYENEFEFLFNHYDKYGNVPDKATFLSKFPDIELVEVTESDKYLVDTIREEYLYYRVVPVIQQSATLLSNDSNEAVEYLLNTMKNLQPNYDLGGVDIIKDAQLRYEQFVDRKEHQNEWYFTSGFQELDDLTHGIQREEELFVIFARTNQGKSWIIEKMCTHIWGLGFNVGYVSPEMSANSIGYRFDTLYKNFSNKGLMWGQDDISNDEYGEYIRDVSSVEHKFIVSTPLDFDKKITVTKLKNWINQYKLDVIAVDGITYMTDERAKRGDNKTTALTNISEDLMSLSMELKVPILVVVQANRGMVSDSPELENIRDSDGIAHNASKVLSVHQKQDNIVELGLKKQRFGEVNKKLNYVWDIDKGQFQFIPSYDDAEDEETTERKVSQVKKTYSDKEDVF